MPRKYNSKKKSTASTRKMTSIAKRVLNKNTETKRRWQGLNEVGLTHVDNALFYDATGITQGTAINERVGNEVRLSGLHFKGVLNNNYDGVNFVRMVVFYGKDQMNFDSSVGIFQNSAGSLVSTLSQTGLNSIYYPINKTRCQVLHDKVYRLAPAITNGESPATSKFFNTFVKLHGKKITFAGNDTGADSADHRLHVGLWVADGRDDFPASRVEVSGIITTYYKD